EPIFTHNLVAFVVIWIAAMAMYVLVYYWTRSASAGVVAGFLFGFYPGRIADSVHVFVNGNHWTPVALLFMDRVFVRGYWSGAAGLALFTVLQTLESFYPLVAFAIVGGVYGLYLALRDVRRLPARVPKLLAVAAFDGAVATAVFSPYLVTKAIWGIPGARFPFLVSPSNYAIGGRSYPGTVMLALAMVAVVDRLRGSRPRDGDDPRLAFLTGGFFVFWSTVYAIRIPLTEMYIPSLWTLLHAVPGFDAVRGGAAVGTGVYLVTAFLAGWGVWVVVERRRAPVRYAITAAIVASASLEVFHPAFAGYVAQ